MANNIFIGQDPLMNSKDYNIQLQELDKIADNIAQRKAVLMQMREQIEQQPQVQQTSKTPIWDEIDTIVKSMSDKEFDIVTNDEEFKDSQNVVMAILQEKYLAMMKPIVENSKEGKEALENHLMLVKKLKKTASKEVDNEINEFKEYKEKYSDMPYAEYLKMKKSKKK